MRSISSNTGRSNILAPLAHPPPACIDVGGFATLPLPLTHTNRDEQFQQVVRTGRMFSVAADREDEDVIPPKTGAEAESETKAEAEAGASVAECLDDRLLVVGVDTLGAVFAE